MNRTPYTPGLWHVDNTGIAVGKRAANGSTDLIADLHHSVYQAERQANARLIAAAPELLEACQAALNHVCGMQVRDIVASAIAKALGHELKAPAISANLNQPL